MSNRVVIPFLLLWHAVACESEPDTLSCIVVRPMNECCSAPVAADADDLGDEPCVQPALQIPDVVACPAAVACQGMSCDYTLSGAAWTRLAEPSDGECAFASECHSDADCVLATDESVCCSCPEAIPRQLPSIDPCWSTLASAPSPGCDACVEVLTCGTCPSTSTAAPRCVPDATGYSKCLLQ